MAMKLELVDAATVQARECGDCSLCCKVMTIDALAKPQGSWCQHARPGKGGCAIYADRPTECQTFSCAWRSGKIPEFLKPNKVKAVIGSNRDGTTMVVHVDPGSPTAFRSGPLAEFIQAVVETGVPVIVTCAGHRVLFAPRGKTVDVRDPTTGKPWLTDKDPERWGVSG